MAAVKPRIKVLIVDDSAVARNLLTRMLSSDPGIEVVGTAIDAYMARDKIKKLNPDILTLDIEMPKMDGITFLTNLMRLHPMPVVMVSTLTEKGASVTMDALEIGAVDFVSKPRIDISHTFENYAQEIIDKVKVAAKARVRQYHPSAPANLAVAAKPLMPASPGVSQRYSIDEVLPVTARNHHFQTTHKLIAIGASTGGTEAIRRILQDMPHDAPGVVVAQHIPVTFSKAFAQRLNSHCEITVKEAEDGEQIVAGHAYIAPGDRHLMVVRDGARWRCQLSDEVPVNRHKPSVDVLFRSVCQSAGSNAIGVILTGMGKDGARGLKDMHDAGAHTIAQDEASSVVWGMPGAAVEMGASSEVLPVERIATRLLGLLNPTES